MVLRQYEDSNRYNSDVEHSRMIISRIMDGNYSLTSPPDSELYATGTVCRQKVSDLETF